MFRKFIALCALMFAAPAGAEFTPAENAELTKLVEAGVLIGKTITSFGGGLRTASELDYSLWKSAQDNIRIAANECINSMGAMGGCGTGPNGPFGSAGRCVDPVRQNYVNLAFSELDSCVLFLSAARASFVNLAVKVPAQASNITQIDNALAKLNSINRSLGYLDPWPASDPTIIGPHGDIRLAQYSHGVLGMIYFQGIWFGGANLFHEINARTPEMYSDYGQGFVSIGAFIENHSRIILASLEVITAEDRAIWEADQAAGSGLRPFPFFRLLGEVELAGSNYNGPVQLFSGRNQRQGLAQNIEGSGKWFGQLTDRALKAAAGDQAETLRLVAHAGTWRDAGFVPAWRYIDQLILSYVLFYHAISAPPPAGCPAGESCQPPCPVCPVCPNLGSLTLNGNVLAECVVQ